MKDINNLQQTILFFNEFDDDEVISGLESIRLDVSGVKEYNQ